MTHPLHASLIRILDAEGAPLGVGFLAAPNLAVTCAHVVRAAHPQDDALHFDFPLLAPGTLCAGRVVYRDEAADIAAVEVPDPPHGVAPIRLVQTEDLWAHPFRVFGVPAGYDEGVWASGVLRDRNAQGWLHIEDRQTGGYPIQPGFSGGPVWDEELRGVVGMVAAAERDPAVRAAFCIPAAQLSAALPALREYVIPPNPYRGLNAFREQDARLFFGREAFAARLQQAVESKPLAAVVGASGAGKSSVVYAGLFPRLRARGDWLLIHFRPGADPFRALAAALLPLLEPQMSETDRLRERKKLAASLAAGEVTLAEVAARILEKSAEPSLLLFADQFEELYTLCADAETRRAFLDALLEAGTKTPGLRVLLTLRADFMGRALEHRAVADALQSGTYLLGPMRREELQAAIVEPAQRHGVTFESGLVERILDEVGEAAGRLPLLEFALTQLWERQEGGRLTHAAYEAIGGVEGRSPVMPRRSMRPSSAKPSARNCAASLCNW